MTLLIVNLKHASVYSAALESAVQSQDSGIRELFVFRNQEMLGLAGNEWSQSAVLITPGNRP